MVASAGYGKNVMDFLCGSGSAFGQTFFAQRVRGNITVTDAFPCASVFFIDVGRTPVFVILLFRRCPVCFTVLSVTQIRTAGERTRLLWFCRQRLASFPKRQKPSRDFFRKGSGFILVSHYKYIILRLLHCVAFVASFR